MSVTYKIGEAASLLNLKTYVLRFWETEFPQVVPLRTEKGQRLYTEEHVALLRRIRHLLHERGLTIEGARRILAEEAARGGKESADFLSLFGREYEAKDEGLAEPADQDDFTQPGPSENSSPFGHDSPLHISAGFEPGSHVEPGHAQPGGHAEPGRPGAGNAATATLVKDRETLRDFVRELEEELENLAVWLRRG